jgi:hypothetical protein
MTLKMNTIKLLLLLNIIFFTVISCSDDDSSGLNNKSAEIPKYTVKLNVQVTDDDTAYYLLTVDDLMGDAISAEGTGIEVGDAYGQFGNRFFLSDIEYNNCEAYDLKDGTFVDSGSFLINSPGFYDSFNDKYFMMAEVSDNADIDNKIHLIDIEDVSIARSVNISSTIIGSDDKEYITDIKGGFLKDNQVYILNWSYIDDDTYAEYNKAFINVYSYPAFKFVKTIEDDRTGNLGNWGNSTNAFEDEKGDFYLFSALSNVTYAALIDKPSGFLKIKDNEDDFDADYFFNVYDKGYKLFSGTYVGNGKAVVRVISAATDEALDTNTYSFWVGDNLYYNIAVIDLYNKTLTIVNDIPTCSANFNDSYLVEGENVYTSVSDGSGETYIYRVNATTATATKGALVEGSLGGIYKN